MAHCDNPSCDNDKFSHGSVNNSYIGQNCGDVFPESCSGDIVADSGPAAGTWDCPAVGCGKTGIKDSVTVCPKCGAVKDHRVKSRGDHINANFRAKMWILLALFFGGLILTGFGFWIAGLGLFVLIMYVLLPNEEDMIEDLVKKHGKLAEILIESEYKQHVGTMMGRTIIKILAIIFITIQFALFYQIAGLLVLFISYFLFPHTYYNDEPHKAMEAWIRPFFGIAISFLIFTILTPSGLGAILSGIIAIIFVVGVVILLSMLFVGLGETNFWKKLGYLVLLMAIFSFIGGVFLGGIFDSPSFVIFFLAIAYFGTALPEYKDESKFGSKIKLGIQIGTQTNGKHNLGSFKGKNFVIEDAADYMYFGLVAACGLPFVTWVFGTSAQAMALPLLVLWFISLIIGFSKGMSTVRPLIGTMVIFLAVLLFSYQFTGVVGTAMFGNLWPTVERYGSMIAAPLGTAWDSIKNTQDDLVLMMTNPSAYYAKQLQGQQIGTGAVVSGGTTKSIELTNFEAINYATANPELDPTMPLIGSIQLENKGQFFADNVNITLDTPRLKNPQEVSMANPEEGIKPLSGDECKFTSCTGASSTLPGTTCSWTNSILPDQIMLMNLKCGQKSGTADYTQWAAGTNCDDDNNVNLCQCSKQDGSETSCNGDCSETCPADKPLKGVLYGGWSVSVPFYIDFSYDVNASLAVDVMDVTLFQTKLMNKEITLKSVQSEYTGGPLKLSLYMQKQPLREGEESFGRISITNTGAGNVTNATLTLLIPNASLDNAFDTDGIKQESLINLVSCSVSVVDTANPDVLINGAYYKNVTCLLDANTKTDKIDELMQNGFATYAFSIKFKDIEDSKNIIILGSAPYTYKRIDSIDMMVARAVLS